MKNCLEKNDASGYGRRDFLKQSLIGGISVCCFPFSSISSDDINDKSGFNLSLDSPTRLYDGKYCWCHPRAGIVPGKRNDNFPRVVMTMNKLDLSGSDIFRGMFGFETNNLGKIWTSPEEIGNLAYRTEIIEGVSRPVAVSDFWPRWHKRSGKLLGTGHTVAYTPEWKVTSPRPRHTSYSVYDSNTSSWASWKKLEMPDSEKFYNSGAGCGQRYDLPDGSILLPVSFRPRGESFSVTVVKCRFDGEILHYETNGNDLSIDEKSRGLYEPSLTYFDNHFFLTIRNDFKGYVARSKDGLNFEPARPWKFTDGTDLGNYNTQQHWVTHSDGLYLVYTRRGANNDHVFRHRAPLFMAKVDPEKLQVIRSTEQILVPERGARLGNFGVTDINKNETWVTVSEWMQPHGVEKYGSDGSVYVARIHWNRPNRLFE